MSGLYIKRKRRQADGSARGRVAPREKRDAASRSSQAPLELVAGREPDHRCAASQDAVGDAGQHIAQGELAVRRERRADALILWLRGALDHATATLFDRELDAQLLHQMPVVVDVTELEFIDLASLNTLMRFHQLERERGGRLSFRHRTQVAQRPLELTRIVQLRSRWATRGTAVMRTPASRSLWRALTSITRALVIDLGRPEAGSPPPRQQARATHPPSSGRRSRRATPASPSTLRPSAAASGAIAQ